MLKKLFTKPSQGFTQAALIIAASSLASRFLGVFRDRVLAGEFGAGIELDMYYAAFRIPDLVFNLVVLGTLSAGFIPVFSRALKARQGENNPHSEAWFVANGILNILGISLIVICSLLIIFTPYLIPLIAPGFDASMSATTVTLTRIMFLSPIFLGLSSVFGGVLQSFRQFFVYSLSPIVYNIGIIFGALFLTPSFGLIGLAVGVVLGAMMHFAIQVPTAISLGYRYKFVTDFRHRHIRQIGQLSVPRTFALGITQFNFFVMTILASSLEIGSITIYNFAYNLQSFPVGLFGISFAIAIFPTLADQAGESIKNFTNHFSSTVKQILFYSIPATFLLITLKAQVVRLILGSGKFDWPDTVLTIQTLEYFVLGLFAQALIPLFARGFYALHNTKQPLVAAGLGAGINIVLGLYFRETIGVAGLALAFSVAGLVQLTYLWLTLRLKTSSLGEKMIIKSASQIIFASLAMAGTAQSVKMFIGSLVGTETFFEILIQGGLAGLAGVLVYIAVALAVGNKEMIAAKNKLQLRLTKRAS